MSKLGLAVFVTGGRVYYLFAVHSQKQNGGLRSKSIFSNRRF
jgi:hypothetical protein